MIVVELLTNVFKHGYFESEQAYLRFFIGENEGQKMLRVSNSAINEAEYKAGTGTLLIDIFTRQLKGKKEIRQESDGFQIEVIW
jgi:two-component sensor histidine kinase